MTEFEQEVITGLATLQAEMREVRKTLEGVAVIDRKVIALEHDIHGLRAELGRSRAERQAETAQLRGELAELGRQLGKLSGRVTDLSEAKKEVQTGLAWSGRTLQIVWSIASAIGGALLVWLSK